MDVNVQSKSEGLDWVPGLLLALILYIFSLNIEGQEILGKVLFIQYS